MTFTTTAAETAPIRLSTESGLFVVSDGEQRVEVYVDFDGTYPATVYLDANGRALACDVHLDHVASTTRDLDAHMDPERGGEDDPDGIEVVGVLREVTTVQVADPEDPDTRVTLDWPSSGTAVVSTHAVDGFTDTVRITWWQSYKD